MARRRWWQGLFARVTLAYAIGALLLSIIVAVSTFTIARNRLVSVERSGRWPSSSRTRPQVRQQLEGVPDDLEDETKRAAYVRITDNLRRTNGAGTLLLVDGNEVGTLGTLGLSAIPTPLQERVIEDRLADFRHRVSDEEGGGETRLAVGINLVDLEAKYYEVLSLASLEDTLDDSACGCCGVGRGQPGRGGPRLLLGPPGPGPGEPHLRGGRAIAEGDFKTRLDLQTDPDLAVLSETFNDMVEALRTRIERDERFASDVSHELRSPLMTLTPSVEILERRKGSLPEVAQKAVTLLGRT